MLQVLHQDETPLLYSLVFGEGVVNDATSVVLFNAIQSFDMSKIDPKIALHFIGNFLYLFFTSTVLGVIVSQSQYQSLSVSLFLLFCVCQSTDGLFKKTFPLLSFLQAGLLCAYIIKKLYFGRYRTKKSFAAAVLF